MGRANANGGVGPTVAHDGPRTDPLCGRLGLASANRSAERVEYRSGVSIQGGTSWY